MELTSKLGIYMFITELKKEEEILSDIESIKSTGKKVKNL